MKCPFALKRILYYFGLTVCCAAFYFGITYLKLHDFLEIPFFTNDNRHLFLRDAVAVFSLLYGVAAGNRFSVPVSQGIHLVFSLIYRLIRDGSLPIFTEWTKIEEIEATAPDIVLSVIYALIPVVFSYAVSLALRQYLHGMASAGRDRILFDRKTNAP